MTPPPYDFSPFTHLMQAEGLPTIAERTFAHYYRQLVDGQTGLITEAELEPVSTLPDADTLSPSLAEIGRTALAKTIFLKLNGGLGTSMGLAKAKSLLTVKDRLTFLDIIAKQAMAIGLPLVLMNSFNTRADTLTALEKYPALKSEIPLDFLQHKVPKINRADLTPARWPQNRDLEWCPPGHGDIYTALVTSGILDTLLANGYEYAFVSNADNLGAVMDTTILGHFAHTQAPFMMEVADRTEADKKGGHLARRAGRLILRESAQCPTEEMDAFQDIERYKYFNTNNLWLNLPALQQLMAANDNVLGLPMIRNAKTVDPRDPTSPPVYQLETAMGSAIAVFEGAQAIRVPRSRFAPVKTCNDLLAVRSDAYILSDDFRVIGHPQRSLGPLMIELDSRYYKMIADLESRFPHGAPSLLACTRLRVEGDIKFGADVVLEGDIALVNASPEQVEVDSQFGS